MIGQPVMKMVITATVGHWNSHWLGLFRWLEDPLGTDARQVASLVKKPHYETKSPSPLSTPLSKLESQPKSNWLSGLICSWLSKVPHLFIIYLILNLTYWQTAAVIPLFIMGHPVITKRDDYSTFYISSVFLKNVQQLWEYWIYSNHLTLW